MGGAAAGFWTFCLREALGSRRDSVRGFGMHSSGMKFKGDGVLLDYIPYPVRSGAGLATERFGDCEDCEYYPFVPQGSGPKACIFGSQYDALTNNGQSLQQFQKLWQGLGNSVHVRMHANPAASKVDPDQHIYWHSYMEMLECLDDGRGVLLPQGTPFHAQPAPP